MSGIRGLLGFQFWVDNEKRAPIEALLQNKDRISPERAAILKELETEISKAIQVDKGGSLFAQ
jgi:hypothetical protein